MACAIAVAYWPHSDASLLFEDPRRKLDLLFRTVIVSESVFERAHSPSRRPKLVPHLPHPFGTPASRLSWVRPPSLPYSHAHLFSGGVSVLSSSDMSFQHNHAVSDLLRLLWHEFPQILPYHLLDAFIYFV